MRKRTLILVILLTITGLSLLLYPTVSNYLKSLSFRRATDNYVAVVDPMDDQQIQELLDSARAYNERLAVRGVGMLILSEEERAEYNSLLDVDGSGIMGYVSVPKVNITLPIYHGTGDEALQNGVGHLESSSLPVGGPDTHAVLSAHTGLPSAQLFTNIDQLVEGDVFTLRVLKETLTYEVDQILVVLPDETTALQVQPGEDYCTLVTCTPYGVNTHRLLVRGRRVPTPPQGEAPAQPAIETGGGLNAAPILICLALGAAATALVIFRKKQMPKRAKRPAEKKETTPNPPEP